MVKKVHHRRHFRGYEGYAYPPLLELSQEKLRRKPKLLAPNKTQIVRLEQTALVGYYTRASLQGGEGKGRKGEGEGEIVPPTFQLKMTPMKYTV